MDNAGNCNTTAKELEIIIPHFQVCCGGQGASLTSLTSLAERGPMLHTAEMSPPWINSSGEFMIVGNKLFM